MATYNKFNQFVEDLAHGVHNFSNDTVTIALTDASNAPAATDAVLGDLTEISYSNLSSRAVVTDTSEQSGGTYSLVLTDHTLTASGAVATFRYVVHYNDTPSNPADPLIQWYDHGSNVTLANGETYDIDYDDGGLFTLA